MPNLNGNVPHRFHHLLTATWLLSCVISAGGALPPFASARAVDEVTVTIRLHSPGLPEDTAVFITGGAPQLGNWHPGKVKMSYAGEHVWTHQVKQPAGQTLEYKYTLGSWKREAAGADGSPLQNLSVTFDRDKVVNDQILLWTKGDRAAAVTGQITGTVKFHRQVQLDDLPARDLIVWLPPDYDQTNHRYPVLYMHDGQNIVDPRTSSFGVDWSIDESCTKLIAEGKIPPLIVVGIYNTAQRTREYLLGDKGTAYRKFVAETVKPLIDRQYRTRPEREHCFAGGSSAGGLCAFILVWEHPGTFSGAICMSPSFQFKNRSGTLVTDYVTTVRENNRPTQPVVFYIYNGGFGLEKMLQPGVDEMVSALQEKGFRSETDFFVMNDKTARHHEAAWAKHFPKAIEWLLRSK